MTKTHPRWKAVSKGGVVIRRERIALKDCPGCRHRACHNCLEPYTVSTAEHEKYFCSQACENKAGYDPEIPPTDFSKARRWTEVRAELKAGRYRGSAVTRRLVQTP